jgi:hypothetical protein
MHVSFSETQTVWFPCSNTNALASAVCSMSPLHLSQVDTFYSVFVPFLGTVKNIITPPPFGGGKLES